MKKFLTFIVVLAIILGGGYFVAQQYYPELITEVNKLFVQENDGDAMEKEDDEEGADEMIAYCNNKGGIVENHERDEGTMKVCFINDGLDGIRCEIGAFFKKECGHGETQDIQAQRPKEIEVQLNANEESEIAMIVGAPNGEAAMMTTKIVDGTEFIDQIIFRTADDNTGVITANEFGLPETLAFNNNLAVFSNYTDTTVDIKITFANGDTEERLAAPVEIAGKAVGLHLIPQAFAASPPPYSLAPDSKANRQKHIKDGYYPHTFGQIFQVVSCGTGATITALSGGTASPLLYITCGSVITRALTSVTEIGPCKGDVLQCALDLFIDNFGPVTLRYGVNINGKVKNAITGTPIEISNVHLRDGENNTLMTNQKGAGGDYSLQVKSVGKYAIDIVAGGFKDRNIPLTANQNTLIVDSTSYPFKDGSLAAFDIELTPDGYIEGEVIDAKEGEGIRYAKLELMESGNVILSDETDDEGNIFIEPPLGEPRSLTLRIAKKGYKPASQNIFLTYDVEKHTEKYILNGFNGIIKLEPEEEEEEEATGSTSNLDGAHNKDFAFTFTDKGLTNNGGGSLSIIIGDDLITSCFLSLDGTATGKPELPPNIDTSALPDLTINGTYSGSSDTCIGSLEASTGYFTLTGTLSGLVSFSSEFGGDSLFTEDDPYTVDGKIENGEITGTLNVPGVASIQL